MTAESILPQETPRAAALRAADETFEALYLLHRDTVFHYLRGRCLDDDEALDLSAVTFERALVALRGPGLSGPPLPWLLRVARNAAIDRQRRARTRQLLLGVLGRAPHQSAPAPESAVLRREANDAVRMTLARLPDGQRDALALRYWADLAITDVAALLGKSEAATRKLISRGLGRLKELHHDAE